MHIDRAWWRKHSFTTIKYLAVHLPVVYRCNYGEDDTADMSSALFQKDVLIPCSFYHPKTCYSIANRDMFTISSMSSTMTRWKMASQVEACSLSLDQPLAPQTSLWRLVWLADFYCDITVMLLSSHMIRTCLAEVKGCRAAFKAFL